MIWRAFVARATKNGAQKPGAVHAVRAHLHRQELALPFAKSQDTTKNHLRDSQWCQGNVGYDDLVGATRCARRVVVTLSN